MNDLLWKRRAFALYQGLTCLLAIKYALRDTINKDPWFVGDWLINYKGGFIRRGLPGELIMLLGNIVHLPQRWLVFAISSIFYLVFQVALYRMTARIRWDYALTLLLLSPATLAFETLNPSVGFRKEVIIFAVLAWMVMSRWVHNSRPQLLSALVAFLCVGLALSHELSLLYMPYFFAALILQRRSLSAAFRIALLPTVAALITAVIVCQHPGDLTIAAQICTSVGGTLEPFGIFDGNVCSGAIVWLQETLVEAHLQTMHYVHTYHYYRLYFILSAAAFAPAIIVARSLYADRLFKKDVLTISGCVLVSFGATSLLFYSGMDWGRWIHIHAVCIMILLVKMKRRSPRPSLVMLSQPALSRLKMVVAGLYATCWILPVTVTASDRPIMGYFDVYRMLYGHPVHHAQLDGITVSMGGGSFLIEGSYAKPDKGQPPHSALADVMLVKGVPEHIRSDNVLTQERKDREKRRSLSIPYGMCLTTTVPPSGFHEQGLSVRP